MPARPADAFRPELDFGRAFRVVRAATGLSQGMMAHRAGISGSYLSLLEAGKRKPALGVVTDFAAAAGVPTELLTLLAQPGHDDTDLAPLRRLLDLWPRPMAPG